MFSSIPGGYVTPNGNVVMSNGGHGVITPNGNVIIHNTPLPSSTQTTQHTSSGLWKALEEARNKK